MLQCLIGTYKLLPSINQSISQSESSEQSTIQQTLANKRFSSSCSSVSRVKISKVSRSIPLSQLKFHSKFHGNSDWCLGSNGGIGTIHCLVHAHGQSIVLMLAPRWQVTYRKVTTVWIDIGQIPCTVDDRMALSEVQ
jgi:hypothetical protein